MCKALIKCREWSPSGPHPSQVSSWIEIAIYKYLQGPALWDTNLTGALTYDYRYSHY